MPAASSARRGRRAAPRPRGEHEQRRGEHEHAGDVARQPGLPHHAGLGGGQPVAGDEREHARGRAEQPRRRARARRRAGPRRAAGAAAPPARSSARSPSGAGGDERVGGALHAQRRRAGRRRARRRRARRRARTPAQPRRPSSTSSATSTPAGSQIGEVFATVASCRLASAHAKCSAATSSTTPGVRATGWSGNGRSSRHVHRLRREAGARRGRRSDRGPAGGSAAGVEGAPAEQRGRRPATRWRRRRDEERGAPLPSARGGDESRCSLLRHGPRQSLAGLPAAPAAHEVLGVELREVGLERAREAAGLRRRGVPEQRDLARWRCRRSRPGRRARDARARPGRGPPRRTISS